MKTAFRNPMILLTFLSVLISCQQAYESGRMPGTPPVEDEPLQTLLENQSPIVIRNDSGTFILTPVAEYSVSGRVVSRKSYSRHWQGSLSPADLALAWGRLADTRMDEYIRYSQRNRWYYYRYSHDCPVDRDYIISHSANNHIIPATENLSIALGQVSEDDLVTITGYLVKLTGTTGRGRVNWGTSTTRTDSGDRSCELIYARSLRIHDRIFR